MADWRTSLPDRLAEAARRHGVPGASIAVGHDGDLVESVVGVLDAGTGVEVTPDSLFLVGSVTKPWTATLVLQLVDEGRLDLDVPVARYLPEFAVVDADATATVTARHLLSHTGGFAGDLFLDTGDGADHLDRYLERLRVEATAVHAPGAMFSYCNSGFCVLGALVGRLRGTTWEDAVRRRVAGPLGGRHLAFSPDEAGGFATATGHLPGDRAVDDRMLPRSNAAAGSRIRAAPRELVRFGRGIGDLLSTDAIAEMRAPQVAAPGFAGRDGDHWGLGLELWTWSGARVVGHDGGVPGQAAIWRVLPDHDLVVALSINADAATTGMTDDVVIPLIEEIAGITAPPRPAPPADPAPADGRFAGRYATPLWEFEVTVDGPALVVRRTPRGLVAQLGRPAGADRYVPLDGDTYVSTGRTSDHDIITFLDGGRYLHHGRAAVRS